MKHSLLRMTTIATVALGLSLSAGAIAAKKETRHYRSETQTQAHTKKAVGAVNINIADASTLETLKGIGAKKAELIVAYRQEHGSFKNLNDLTKVKGIGEKSLARLLKNNPGKMTAS